MSDTNYFAALDKHNYLNMETFRKDGTGVRTPVWFAADPEVDIRSQPDGPDAGMRLLSAIHPDAGARSQ